MCKRMCFAAAVLIAHLFISSPCINEISLTSIERPGLESSSSDLLYDLLLQLSSACLWVLRQPIVSPRKASWSAVNLPRNEKLSYTDAAAASLAKSLTWAAAFCFLAGVCSSRLLIPSEVLVTLPPALFPLLGFSLSMQNPFVQRVTVSTPRLQIDLLTLICTWEMITVSLLFEFQSGRASLLNRNLLKKNVSLKQWFSPGFASEPGFYIRHVVTHLNKIERISCYIYYKIWDGNLVPIYLKFRPIYNGYNGTVKYIISWTTLSSIVKYKTD